MRAHLPSSGREPVGGITKSYDSWPVRRQTYGYVPSHRASGPTNRFQIKLLYGRGTCVRTTCSRLSHNRETAGN